MFEVLRQNGAIGIVSKRGVMLGHPLKKFQPGGFFETGHAVEGDAPHVAPAISGPRPPPSGLPHPESLRSRLKPLTRTREAKIARCLIYIYIYNSYQQLKTNKKNSYQQNNLKQDAQIDTNSSGLYGCRQSLLTNTQTKWTLLVPFAV